MLHCQLYQQLWKLQTLTSQSARIYPRIDLSTSCAPGPGPDTKRCFFKFLTCVLLCRCGGPPYLTSIPPLSVDIDTIDELICTDFFSWDSHASKWLPWSGGGPGHRLGVREKALPPLPTKPDRKSRCDTWPMAFLDGLNMGWIWLILVHATGLSTFEL